jgi:hypothetical protein
LFSSGAYDDAVTTSALRSKPIIKRASAIADRRDPIVGCWWCDSRGVSHATYPAGAVRR